MRRPCAPLFVVLLLALLCPPLRALASAAPQAGVPPPAIQLQGLRSQNHHGSFKDGASLPDGSLVLLYDQGDGLRLLKTDPGASAILAGAQAGAAGDTGVALATDGVGNLYVAGTSSSGQLQGTGGAAFPSPADTSTNSFIARFDSNLNLVFLTFLGAGKTEVTGISATADAVFVTGITYSTGFPTTPGTLQELPSNSGGNAFVQRFSVDGASVRYATFLDAPGGTTPTAIAADASDQLYIAGATSAPAFPTRSALQPTIFGTSSGFLSQLAADGGSLVFSTFVAGSGISSLALDSSSGTLLLSGNLAPGQFPLAHATAPLADVPYQSVLRLSADGQTLLDSALLLPGNESSVQPSPDGSLWVSGSLSLPLAPALNDGPGDAYALHLTQDDSIDKLLRLGGTATDNPAYASLQTEVPTLVISPDGSTVYALGTVIAHTAASLRTGQSFDLALNAVGSTVLPSSIGDLLPSTCAEGTDCSGTGGLLSVLSPAASAPFLAVSTGDGQTLTVRNTGPASASALTITATGFTDVTNCPQALTSFAQCSVALSGGGPGTLSVTATGASSLSLSLPGATSTTGSPLVFDTEELEYGILTASAPTTRNVTITNLSSTPQTFASGAENLPTNASYTLAETASTCPGSSAAHTLAAGGSCTLTLTLTASSLPANDGPIRTNWAIGSRTLSITGYTEAAPLSLSASELDFGPQPTTSTSRLPLYLYLSNNSAATIAHSPLALPPNSPFSLLDSCPSTLAPSSVCQLAFTYSQPNAPAFDSLTVQLDQGLSVLLTGETLSGSPTPTPLPASPLLVTPLSVTFSATVPVSGVSAEILPVQVTNPSALPVPLSASVLGDFALENTCGASVAAGATCTLDMTFMPSQPGTRDGLLLLSTGAANQTVQVTLSGTAAPILPQTNGTLDLGQTVVGEPIQSWFQLQGTFPQLSATVSGPGLAVALLADDGTGHGTLPTSAFGPAASAECTDCWLAISYLPATAGVSTGILQLSSAVAGNPLQVALTATAVPNQGLVLTPALQDFGAISVGSSSAPITFALTNLLPNASAATVQAVNVTGDFTLLQTSPTSPPCTGALSANTACGILISFVPSSTGRRTGPLQLTTDTGSVLATLTGTGISPASAPIPPASTQQPAIAVFPTQADFGAQTVGSLAQIRHFTVTNATSAQQTIALSASRNFPFAQAPACPTLASGASCSFSLAFVPGAGGPITGSVILTATPDDGTSPTHTVLYLRGFGTASGSLAFSVGTQPSAPLDFGSVASGASPTQAITITNTGSTPVTLRHLASTAPFYVSTTCLGPLNPNASCELDVTYTSLNQLPSTATQAPRTDRGTLLVETDALSSPATIYLTGTSVASTGTVPNTPASLPTYTLSMSALSFANAQPGSPPNPQVVTVTNNGSVPVVFAGLQASAAFLADSPCTVLQPGASCPINISFNPPQNAEAASLGTLTILTNAADAVDFISLLGTS